MNVGHAGAAGTATALSVGGKVEPDRWDARLPVRWLQGETEKTPVFIIPVAFGWHGSRSSFWQEVMSAPIERWDGLEHPKVYPGQSGREETPLW